MRNQSIARTGMATLLALLGMSLSCDQQSGSPGIGPSALNGPLAVTSLVPNTGALNGTTSVTIVGRGLQPGAAVTFDGTAATTTANNGGVIFARTPAHAAGTVDVVVTNPDGASAMMPGAFTYAATPPPIITAVSPNSGSTSGGWAVTITGTGFRGTGPTGGQPGVIVELGGTPIKVLSVEAGTIRAKTSAHLAGQVDVVVTNADGQVARLAGGYTYVPVQALDFNGDWQGFYQYYEDDIPMRFTIRNNVLTSISCGSSPTLSLAVTVINGAFSFRDDGVAVSGRLVSPSTARGTIDLAPCIDGNWSAGRQ